MLAIALNSSLLAHTLRMPQLGSGIAQPQEYLDNGETDLPKPITATHFHTHAVECRTALEASVIDVIHSLVDEQISPVLVRLATTGPQVQTVLVVTTDCLHGTELASSLHNSTGTTICTYAMSSFNTHACKHALLVEEARHAPQYTGCIIHTTPKGHSKSSCCHTVTL